MAADKESVAKGELSPSDQCCIQSGSGSSEFCRAAFGFFLLKGRRPKPMEDFHMAEFRHLEDGSEVGLFGIFDGYAGRYPAKYLQKNLFNAILLQPLFREDPLTAITEAYHAIDQQILAKAADSDKWHGGSTATTCLLLDGGTRLIVANVGDSRAVISHAGVATSVSRDHDPAKPEERAMVESKGGFVLQRPGSITHRVDAKLAMSRAFGDADIKEHLSIEPDIYEARISEEDEILIVASDGVWQAMTCQEAVGFILSAKSPEVAARALARRAIDLGSADDISAIVIWLNQMVVP